MLTRDVKPKELSDSAYSDLPFDKGKKELEKDGYSIIFLEENARLRMQEGAIADVSKYGNYVSEAFVYDPKTELWYLTKNSPIMQTPRKATSAHRNGQEFYLTDEQLQRALENSVQITDKSILTGRFGEDKLTDFAFGDVAKDYGLFLNNHDIQEMPIWLPSDKKEKSYSRPVWFYNLGNGSGLNGIIGALHYGVRLRGIVRSQKISTGNEG